MGHFASYDRMKRVRQGLRTKTGAPGETIE
jgi:hypothetical protein